MPSAAAVKHARARRPWVVGPLRTSMDSLQTVLLDVRGLGARGVQGAATLASTPDQRVVCTTPPTVQLSRRLTALPAAAVPGTLKLTAVARTSGAAWAANGVTVAVPEMPPTVMVAPAHPAGKRAGFMLMRL